MNASQFRFRARYSTTLQCMRQTYQLTLNLNNNMSTAVVFLDIENAFETTCHPFCYINFLNWSFRPVGSS
jgi:hypothetical protein